ncbi:MAG: EAL domain-containing protein [Mycobacteriales bacterium]|nr:EAL domain-containing protein [Mycobacteriales bacterium]
MRFDDASSSYGAVLHAIGQAVVVSDLEGRIVVWSRGAEALYGWVASETVGRCLAEFLGPSASLDRDAPAGVTDPHDTWVGEAVVLRQDGSTMPVLVTSSPVLGQAGEPLGRVAVTVDLSAQKRAEETAQHLSAIVASTADAVFTKDLDGTIRSWNRGAEEIYGYTADDVIGRHVSLLAPDNDGAEVRAILAAVSAGETIRGLETVRRRRDGSSVDISITVSPLYGEDDDVVGASVIGRDITDRRDLERQLARLATHDTLTDLPNRVLLVDRLTQALARAARHGRPLAVLFVDLDRFRLVNADVGYLVGDQVLVEVAGRLRAAVAPGDTVARFAGDSFVVVCEEISAEDAEAVAASIRTALAQPTAVTEIARPATATMGITDAGGSTTPSADVLIRCAQAAMFTAKASARGGWRVFDRAMEEQWAERISVAAELRRALAAEAFELHYQPVVELASGRLMGVEALIRWPHPVRGWISPDLFVPLAEEIGLIVELDDWVISTACRDIAGLRGAGALPLDVVLAVNVSARDVGPDLIARVIGHAGDAGLSLDRIELEVTETALMADSRAAGHVLQTLRDAGVGVALDDFGTGYSSLTYLRNLPLTNIKLDRAFVQHIATRPSDLAIAEAVMDLGRAVGVRTTAEAIETPEQLALLHCAGCHAGQGSLWSSALPPAELADLVRRHPQGFLTPQPLPARPAPRQRTAVDADTPAHHRLLQLHAAGASLATIATALNTERYRTVHGHLWNSAGVARVIADRAELTRMPAPGPMNDAPA